MPLSIKIAMLPQTMLCLGFSQDCLPFITASLKRGFLTVALGLHAEDTLYDMLCDCERHSAFITHQDRSVPVTFYKASSSLPHPVICISAQHFLDNCAHSSFDSFVSSMYSSLDFNGLFFMVMEQDICCDDEIESVVKLISPRALLPVPLGRTLTHMGKINSKFNLPGISYECALNCTDKVKTHELQESHHCVHGKYRLFNTKDISDPYTEYAKSLVSGLCFPVILKPRFGSGSHGIFVCLDMDDLILHIERLSSAPETEYLIENFILGDLEFSLSGLVTDNELKVLFAINKCAMTRLPARQEIAYTTCFDFEPFMDVIKAELNKNIKALNIGSGIFHADTLYCLASDEACVVDIAARHPGNNVSSILSACDLSLIDLWFDYVLEGKELSDETARALQDDALLCLKKNSVFSSFLPLPVGEVKHIPTLSELNHAIAECDSAESLDYLRYCADILDTCADKSQGSIETLSFFVNVSLGDTIEPLRDCSVSKLGLLQLKHVSALQGLTILEKLVQSFAIDDKSSELSLAV